ncbi:MAG: ABC transporter permease [Acidimicrobiia bacterium]|nr:ABC transporter permease [Acidimicrobiia bacterium]
MATTTTATPPTATTSPPAVLPRYKGAELGRSTAQASRSAFAGLLLRDLTVLKKNLKEFLPRTILQPFLLVFVFLYVFPTIGQGIGSGRGAAGESAFATVLVAGVIGLSIMFQGIQAVALPMVQEFGYTREIEDRVLAPLPVSLVSIEKIVSGALQGLLAALIVFPIAAVVHSNAIHIHLQVHWLQLLIMIPLACIMCSSLGMTFGTRFDPRTVPMLFGVIVIPMTFLGGTYYAWTALSPVKVAGFSWLQVLVLANPLIYVTEGFRAALTPSHHMHLYVIYPVLIGFCALFLWQGLTGFRRRVLS